MTDFTDVLKRYKRFVFFLWKYRNSELFNKEDEALKAESNKEEVYKKPEELAEDLKDMGPTFVKLGQLLSTRPDLLPDNYMQALAELQDDVAYVPFDKIREIMEDEIGMRLSKAFQSFEEEPLASASIGQVHKAVTKNGRKVAVKIRRPGIKKDISEELEELQRLADLAAKHFDVAQKYTVDKVMEEFRFMLLQELDYAIEADNLVTLGKNLGRFEFIFVPQPIPDYCTSRVLTMDFVEGEKVTEISSLKKVESNYEPLVEELVECYLKQIILDGFAHADPHPGNIHLTNDNRIALMDLGMVARFSKDKQEGFLKIMVAISRYDAAGVAEALLGMSKIGEDANLDGFKKHIDRLVLEHRHKSIKEMQTGQLIIQMNRIAASNGIEIAVELNVLGKILLNIDRIVAALAPDFDLQNAVSNHVEKMMVEKAREELKFSNFLSKALETKKLAEDLPGRINKITEKLANDQFEIKVNAIDEKRLTDGFQKVANRITLGLVIAAMIIGAALLMNVPSAFTVFGYPVLPIVLFLFAAVVGFALVLNIFFKDEDFKRRK
ncbi:MAG: AarF/ABC1/UbiB kinase family protein [Saprospirales bacterium]|nr:MAG: AarF/ABC1/UbiB kinase family protein [Saprospirales bacterium]